MSTRKGAGSTRTRKPAHQNSFAFRHNPKSQKTAKILASTNTGLCASCHDKVEWRKQYRKYRPLRHPATCNDCHKKNITAAYHRLCTPCARERRVCPFCCTKGRPRADPDGEGAEGQEEGEEEKEEGKGEEGGGGSSSIDGVDEVQSGRQGEEGDGMKSDEGAGGGGGEAVGGEGKGTGGDAMDDGDA